MPNPILQRLNQSQTPNNMSFVERLGIAKNILSGKNPDKLFNDLVKSNDQFKQFANHIQGKTLEDIALEYDLDVNLLKQFL